MRPIPLLPLLLFVLTLSVRGQDDRERHYLYPVFPDGPGHAILPIERPKVEGWARERVEEQLNRGMLALPTPDREVYLGWRLLKTDDPDVSFNVYRSLGDGTPDKLNSDPLSATTDFVDRSPDLRRESAYWVRPVVAGRELDPSERAVVDANPDAEQLHYKSILFQGDYLPNRIAVADLNGDGAYDFVIKQPHNSIDPAGSPHTDGMTYKLEAYLSDGTFLWRKDLGPGIETGIWYSPFVAYDFSGNGKAEVAVKTAPGAARDPDGRVREGEERVTLLDGMTGEELASAPWPERDLRYGGYNRLNRNQMGVAYLDGRTPSLLVARGTYKLMVLDAYHFHGGALEKHWRWDGDEQNPVIRTQGAHTMISADVDGDERDEVILGSVVIDDNGAALWSTGFGHPDKMFVSDIDPTRPGMEILYGIEDWHMDGQGVVLVDAKTGKTIWNIGHATYHIGRAMVADIDPSLPGLEVMAWEDPKGGTAGASPDRYMLSARGDYLARNVGVPDSYGGHWVFWDSDLLRELMAPDRSEDGRGIAVSKYNGPTLVSGIEGRVVFTADLLGDWREEIVTAMPGELRIYTTPIPANDRRVTLVQDPVYRSTVAHNSMGYYQPPVTSYYLGVPPEEADQHEPVVKKPRQ